MSQGQMIVSVTSQHHDDDAENENRKIKRLFSLSATISPVQQAVNRVVFSENSPLSTTNRTLHRPKSPHSDRFTRAQAARDRQPRCRIALVVRIRPPKRDPAAAPASAAARVQANPDA